MKKLLISLVVGLGLAFIATGCGDVTKTTNVSNPPAETPDKNETKADKNGFEYVSQGRMSSQTIKDADGNPVLKCTLFFKANEKVDSTALIGYKIVNDELTLPTQKIIGTAGSLSSVNFEYNIYEADADKYLACGAEYYQENGTAVQVRSRGKKVSGEEEAVVDTTTSDDNTSDDNATDSNTSS